jgi:hypothetical protein
MRIQDKVHSGMFTILNTGKGPKYQGPLHFTEAVSPKPECLTSIAAHVSFMQQNSKQPAICSERLSSPRFLQPYVTAYHGPSGMTG